MTDTHLCRKCGESRPVSQFYVQDKETGRLNPWCKPCYKTWYTGRAKQVTPESRVCPACGITFKPRRANMMACSVKCKAKRRNDEKQAVKNEAKVGRVCVACAQPIPVEA